MRNPDLAIYLLHALFYSVFGLRVFRRIETRRAGGSEGPAATDRHTASFSRALLVFHGLGFAVLYSGVGSAVIPRRVPHLFIGQRLVGSAVIFAFGTALWIPTAIVWLGFVLIAIGGDLRARAEEALLDRTFDRIYREYCSRTRRFLPGIY